MRAIGKLESRVATLDPTARYRPANPNALQAKRLEGRAGVAMRFRIKTRDNFTCQVCGAVEYKPQVVLDIDHIVPLHLGGQDIDANRQCLCVPCHEAKSAAETRGRF